jgi:molybdopterin/thiamine biosynthesis adenylyltransferase
MNKVAIKSDSTYYLVAAGVGFIKLVERDYVELLKGRLLSFSGIDMTFREIKAERNPDCIICKQDLEVQR